MVIAKSHMSVRAFFSHGSRALLVFSLGLVGVAAASANGTSAPSPAPVAVTPTANDCTVGEKSGLDGLACSIGAELGTSSATALAASEPTADRGGGAGLSVRFLSALARRLGASTRVLGSHALDLARNEIRRNEALVFVALDIRGGAIAATADLYPAPPGFWDRVRGAGRKPPRRVRAVRAVDAEIAAFFAPLKLAVTSVQKISLPTNDVVALACATETPTGAAHLVLVGRHRIQLGHIEGGRFQSKVERAWSDLSPVAPSPLREPIAAVDPMPDHFDVGITDRSRGLRLDGSLATVSELTAPIPWRGVGCLARRGVALGSLVPCAPGAPPAVPVNDASDIDAVAGATVIGRDGNVHRIAAYRRRSDASVILVDGAGKAAEIPNAGSAIAVGDLDLDGAPELVTTTNTSNASEDGIAVRTWGADGTVTQRFSVPVPEGVSALAICPTDGARMSAIVAATPAGLEVVR